jgi:Spy/CpxP family protein refolding chaperone
MEIRPAHDRENTMLKGTKIRALSFVALLFFACSLTTRAQDAGTQESKAQAQAEAGPHHGQRANHLEWLSKELNLTDEEKEKVKPILDEQTKQMHAAQEDTSLTQEQKCDKMKQIHQTTHSQINEILTPEQQKKFAALKEQQKEHHEGSKQSPSEQPKQPY